MYFVLVSLLIGILLSEVVASMVFLFTFLPIRQYAGGYHSKTERRCFFLSTALIALSIFLISILQNHESVFILLPFNIIGVVTIFLFAPIDSKEKPLSGSEKAVYRKKTFLLTLLYIIVLIFSIMFNIGILYSPITVTLFLQGALLIAARFSKRYNKSIAY